MALLSSLFLLVGLILAVALGAQTRPWTWGPALICLAFATVTASSIIWRQRQFPDRNLITIGFVTIAWFSWRAWISPVAELAIADLLLLGSAVGTFIVMRAISSNQSATNVLNSGLAFLIIASIVVMSKQLADPSFAPVFTNRPTEFPSGFFGHYNDCANFLIGSSFILGATAIFGNHPMWARIFWALVCALGLSAVYFSNSRGGILATVGGLAVFISMALVVGQRHKTRWFAPALLCLPVIGIVAAWFLWSGWQSAQEARDSQVGVANVLDNSVRLYLVGIALSCMSLHPWGGGGSRSFSWECYNFWDVQAYGNLAVRPEMVHNELLQSLTDYGGIGGGLLLFLLGTIGISAIYRTFIGVQKSLDGEATSMRIGGCAAFCGMLIQSMFSFVFHLLPGCMMLGLSLALASSGRLQPTKGTGSQYVARGFMVTLGMSFAILLLYWGIKGSKVVHILWPIYFGKKGPVSEMQQVALLSRAVEVWPQATFYNDLAMIRHRAHSSRSQLSLSEAEQAMSDYRSALALNPYYTTSSVNLGHLLALLGRNSEALSQYEKTIQLQGKMEASFKGHYHMTNHLLKMGFVQLHDGSPEMAAASFERGLKEFEVANRHIVNFSLNPDGIQLKSGLTEGLGLALEQLGNLEGALAAYDTMVAAGGKRGHYRAALLLGSLANTAWSERRPSEALTRFQEARQRIELATELPTGVTPEMKAEYVAFLDRSINYLVEAKVEPLKKPEE